LTRDYDVADAPTNKFMFDEQERMYARESGKSRLRARKKTEEEILSI
jgi:hypothetical protein